MNFERVLSLHSTSCSGPGLVGYKDGIPKRKLFFPILSGCRNRKCGLSRNKRMQKVDSALLLVFVQFVAIALLLSVVSAEYQSNAYMQEWVEKNAWPIGYLLNGYLAATLVGFAIGGGFLVFQKLRNSGESRIDRDRL
jgi:hypothetical protein